MLLGIALGATALSTTLDHAAMKRLGARVAADIRQSLLERSHRELLQYTTAFSDVLRARGELVEARLAALAQAVHAAHRDTPPASPAGSDASDERRLPAPRDRPLARLRDLALGAEPAPAPPPQLAVGIAQGVPAPQAAAAEARARAALTAFFADAPPSFVMPWTIAADVALIEGVQARGPADGPFPEGYDPREQIWYQAAARARGTVWNRLVADPLTGKPVLVVSTPVRTTPADGSEPRMLGVAAISLNVDDMLATLKPPTAWGGATEAMICAVIPPDLGPQARLEVRRDLAVRTGPTNTQDLDLLRRGGLIVLARQGYEPPATRADERPDPRPTPTQTPAGRVRPAPRPILGGPAPGVIELDRYLATDARVRDLIAAMTASPSGTHPLGEGDNAYVWAFAALDEESYVVLLVPEADLVKEADQAVRATTQATRHALTATAAAATLEIALISIAAVFVARQVTRPLEKLRDAAARLAAGDLSARADIRTRDERQELAEAFNAMVPKLAERVRMREGLAVAREVQQCLLPRKTPRVRGLQLAGSAEYCDETGGDYFDFIPLGSPAADAPAPRVLIAVGDVCGHGVGAALLMASVRVAVRSRVGFHPTEGLASLAADINRLAADDAPEGRFMTMALLRVDAAARTLEWTSAGHDPALLYDPDLDTFQDLAGVDIPLAVQRDWAYHAASRADLRPGQIIVIGTDGLWEARNPRGEMFGKDRLRDAVREAARPAPTAPSPAPAAAADVAAHILRRVADFRDGTPPRDDTTVVVAIFTPEDTPV